MQYTKLNFKRSSWTQLCIADRKLLKHEINNNMKQLQRPEKENERGFGKKRGHYNSCNLHHFTHYIHLCLPELVKHRPAQSYIFRSLPQLRETQQKMNWHKCLWKRNIRLVGSDPDWALYGNRPVLKSVLSLTEVEQLIDHSHPGGKFKKRKA